jgi:hypothetical protein
MAYPPVEIHNSTPHFASGKVHYPTIFCTDDNYDVKSFDTWKAPGRGVCLVTKITAKLSVFGKDYDATPYESAGTTYSQFAIIQTAQTSFLVTRITSAASPDDKPADYVEPTTKQK